MPKMNELKTWTFSGSEVRTVEVNGEPWWVLKDVCTVLEMDANRAGEVVKRLEQDEYDSIGLTDSLGREQKTYIVNESGLYSVILRSDKPKAKPFRKWVTSEVLPAIRKTGSYSVMDSYQIDDPIERAKRWIAEQEERAQLALTVSVQNQQIAELQPKASYYDVVLNCKDLMSIGKIAKDFGKSAVWLNKWLHEKGVQYKQGDIWLLYQKYAEMGYTSTKTQTFAGDDGETHSKVHTYWTQKGRLFIYALLKADGILPLVEQDKSA
jgi:prophage antirepressor-like protein